jgi:hypothetical protein
LIAASFVPVESTETKIVSQKVATSEATGNNDYALRYLLAKLKSFASGEKKDNLMCALFVQRLYF